jgi:hypothetical protein
VDRTFVLASTHFNRHSTYVALSRHRQTAELFYSTENFVHEAGLADHLSREGQKTNILEHTVPSRTSAWLEQLEREPPLALPELLNPSKAALKDLDRGYEAYQDSQREAFLKELRSDQRTFETQHPDWAKSLQWEMFDCLSVEQRADLLKEDYLALEQESAVIQVGETDHPLYEKIHSLIDDHACVLKYWNRHDEPLVTRMQAVLDKGNTDPEPERAEPKAEVQQEPSRERGHERYLDFEMER